MICKKYIFLMNNNDNYKHITIRKFVIKYIDNKIKYS